MSSNFTLRWLLGVPLLILLLSPHARSAPVAKHGLGHSEKFRNFCDQAPGWTEVALFFLVNFVIHVFTVRPDPGNGGLYYFLVTFLALIFPYTGVLRACRTIERIAALDKIRKGRGDLRCAARAGALCVIARTKGWKTTSDPFMCLSSVDSPSTSNITLDTLPLEFLQETMMSIHGEYCLPPGYMMVRLPIGAAVKSFHEVQHSTCTVEPSRCSLFAASTKTTPRRAATVNGPATVPATVPARRLSNSVAVNKNLLKSSLSTRRNFEIASTYSILHSIAGVAQILSAVATIYKAHFSQISKYGYAAYSLTVIPYALMTAVNLLALLVTPNYPAIYMLESSIMDEARKRGGLFGGTVGILDEVDYGIPVVPSDKNEPCPWEVKLQGSEDGLSYKAHEIKSPTPDQPVISETTAIGHIIFGPGDGLPRAWDHKVEKMRFRKFLEWLLIFYVVVLKDQCDELPGLRLFSRLRNRDLRDVRPSPYRVLYRIFKRKPPPMPETKLPRIGRFKYDPLTTLDRFMFVFSDILLVGIIISPYLIIYGLTGYRPQQSSFSERFWLTAWLVFGQLAVTVRVIWAFVNRFMGDGLRVELKWGIFISIVCGAVWTIPAFCGFFVVAKMILKSSICK